MMLMVMKTTKKLTWWWNMKSLFLPLTFLLVLRTFDIAPSSVSSLLLVSRVKAHSRAEKNTGQWMMKTSERIWLQPLGRPFLLRSMHCTESAVITRRKIHFKTEKKTWVGRQKKLKNTFVFSYELQKKRLDHSFVPSLFSTFFFFSLMLIP